MTMTFKTLVVVVQTGSTAEKTSHLPKSTFSRGFTPPGVLSKSVNACHHKGNACEDGYDTSNEGTI